MAPRSNWKGYLKLSLVSASIAIYPATSSSEKVRFNTLNRATGNRLKRQMVDSVTGDVVENEDMIKGYAVAKDQYVRSRMTNSLRSPSRAATRSTSRSSCPRSPSMIAFGMRPTIWHRKTRWARKPLPSFATP